MNISIQKKNLKLAYYIVLTVLIFILMTPGVMLPSTLRIALLLLIFFPVIFNVDEFPFVFVTFYGISSISFTPVLPTSDIYYVVIVIAFYLLNKKKNRKRFLINCLSIYVYYLISSLLHFDCTSSLIWLMIAILMCDMIRDENDLERIFYSFIIISVFLSILFIIHRETFMIQYDDTGSSDVERSGWTNPNAFGANIAIGGLLSVAYLTNFLRVTKSKFITITCIITSTLTFIVLILNASRGALLAFIIPSFLMLVCSNIKILYKLLLISLVCFFIVYMYSRSNIFDLIIMRMSEDNAATGGGRTEIWDYKLDIFLMEGNIFDILFGIGETATVNLGMYISTHNDIVTSFIAYGIFGLLLFVYFIFVYPIIKSNKNIRPFVLIMLLYMLIECNVVEPFFRGSIVIIMFYFFILKYVMIKNTLKTIG